MNRRDKMIMNGLYGAFGGARGSGKTAYLLANRFISSMYHFDSTLLDKCNQCMKNGKKDCTCSRFVACIIGEDEVSSYVFGTKEFMRELAALVLERGSL